VRNSSLVERFCAEDVRGSSMEPKLWIYAFGISGRGAFYTHRSSTVRSCGVYRSENAGMSSEKTSENLVHRKPKVS
jgi:hypothetical protein